MLSVRYSGVSEGAMAVSLNGCRIFGHAPGAPSAGTATCGHLAVPGTQRLSIEARALTMRVSELVVLQDGQQIWALENTGELDATEPLRFQFGLDGDPPLALDGMASVGERDLTDAIPALFDYADALRARDLQRCARIAAARLERLDRLRGQPQGSALRAFEDALGRLFARSDVHFLSSPRDQVIAEPALGGLAVEFRDGAFRAPIRIRYGGAERPEFDVDARIGRTAQGLRVVA